MISGSILHRRLERLFPILRSLTGPGNRETLAILAESLPGLDVVEVPSGTGVWDWTVPPEWSVREAWIRDARGRTLVDLRDHGLHLVSYSRPFRGRLSFQELQPHLHVHETDREAIPYRTSYYREDWGFCLPRRILETEFDPAGEYEVLVDSALDSAGSLSLGELVLPGRSERSVVVSTYICHPWMANDNLSGVVVAAALAECLAKLDRKWTWRFVFAPETLGTLAWCARNEDVVRHAAAGLVLSTCAGPGRPGWKGCFLGERHWLDRLAARVVRARFPDAVRWPFDPHGSDERQLSSPGMRLPTISFHQARYYDWPGYHSSLDTAGSVTPKALEDALSIHLDLAGAIESERLPTRLIGAGEAMLGPRGLYPTQGGALLPGQERTDLDLILWLQFLCDGSRNLTELAEMLGVGELEIGRIADVLVAGGVLHG